MRRLAELAERGDRSLRLPRGRQTTHGTMWMVAAALGAGLATFGIGATRNPEVHQNTQTIEDLARQIETDRHGYLAEHRRTQGKVDSLMAEVVRLKLDMDRIHGGS
jgi:hypothetical protein